MAQFQKNDVVSVAKGKHAERVGLVTSDVTRNAKGHEGYDVRYSNGHAFIRADYMWPASAKQKDVFLRRNAWAMEAVTTPVQQVANSEPQAVAS